MATCKLCCQPQKAQTIIKMKNIKKEKEGFACCQNLQNKLLTGLGVRVSISLRPAVR